MLKIKDGVDVQELLKYGWEDDEFQYSDNYERKITVDADEGYEGCYEICKVLEREDGLGRNILKIITYSNYDYTKIFKDRANKFYLSTRLESGEVVEIPCPDEHLQDLIQAGLVEKVEG